MFVRHQAVRRLTAIALAVAATLVSAGIALADGGATPFPH